VRPLEEVRGLLHHAEVERSRHKPGILPEQCRTDGPVMDLIQINLAFRIVACVKGGIHLPQIPDHDIPGQKAVEPAQEIELPNG